MAGCLVRCLLLCAVLCSFVFGVTGECTIPEDYVGSWFWLNDIGRERVVEVSAGQWGQKWGESYTCDQIRVLENSSSAEALRVTMLMKRRIGYDCYVCVDVLYRTPNVVQVGEGGCHDDNKDFENKCPGIKASPGLDGLLTYFRRTSLKPFDCFNTFYGAYQIAYGVKGGTCDNPESSMEGPDSPKDDYDNQFFTINFKSCDGIRGSATRTMRFQCLGTWGATEGQPGYTYAAAVDTQEKDDDRRFKCMMTQRQGREFRWVMSAFSRCSQLHSLYNAPIKLIMKKKLCRMPEVYSGRWVWMDSAGKDQETEIDRRNWGSDLRCELMMVHPTPGDTEAASVTMLMKKNTESPCYVCVDVIYRTHSVLQVRQSECHADADDFVAKCPGVRQLPNADQVTTYFRSYRGHTNCSGTFEGVNHFTYEMSWGAGGICDSPDSQISVCYPGWGTPYPSESEFYMTFAPCSSVNASLNTTIQYKCLGSWLAQMNGQDYRFAAIEAVSQHDNRERYRCLLTVDGQKTADNTQRWAMSRFPSCSALASLYNAPVRLVVSSTGKCSEDSDGSDGLDPNTGTHVVSTTTGIHGVTSANTGVHGVATTTDCPTKVNGICVKSSVPSLHSSLIFLIHCVVCLLVSAICIL